MNPGAVQAPPPTARAMVFAIIGISLLLQGAATVLALRVAARDRSPGWASLALAMLLMVARRGFTFYRVLLDLSSPDLGAEWIALLISALMVAGTAALARVRETGAAAPPGPPVLPSVDVRFLTRTAVLLGAASVAGGCLIGAYAYQASRGALLKSVLDTNLNLARAMSGHLDTAHRADDRPKALDELARMWRHTDRRFASSTLRVIGADGRVVFASRGRERVGEPAPEALLHDAGGHNRTLADLLAHHGDWSGEARSSAGDPQVAALAWSVTLGGLVGIDVPAAAVEAEIGPTVLPWAVGYALVTGVLLPLALGLLHRAYGTARGAAVRAQRALRESEERLDLVVAGAPIVLFAVDRLGTFTLSDGRGLGALALRRGEAVGRSAFEMYGDYPQIVENLHRALDGEEVTYLVEVADRWYETTCSPLRGERGEVTGAIGVAHDVTARKQAEAELLHLALHDPLTRLPSRALFLDRLGHAIERCRREGESIFAVLFLDLDRFKVVNDSLGHAVGDELLIGTARKLEKCVQPGDTVARLGGDEFTILLEDLGSEADAAAVAERIQQELRSPFTIEGHEVFTTASIGLAVLRGSYERPADILRDADTAMYRAKALGRARHVVFDRDMHERAVELMQLETGLRRAVDRGEFRVWYQPIVSLASGHLAGFEALVRWQHPGRGLLLPDEFVRIAEETGLIVPIGSWVLQEACRQMHAWAPLAAGGAHLSVVVNLSARQWIRPELLPEIDRVLQTTGLAQNHLKLEITEGVLIENAEALTAHLIALRERDIHIYLDDFGTGYSSLSALHRFPVDALKIDRSFVARIGPNGENSEIVRSIVTLGHHLGKYVVAEGIETAPQLAALRDLECEYGQGNYFSPAVEPEAAARILTADRRW